jgi:tetratricopeptide (TPR) repeat protein
MSIQTFRRFSALSLTRGKLLSLITTLLVGLAQPLPALQGEPAPPKGPESPGHQERTKEDIGELQGYVRQHPADAQGYILLGRSYAENSQSEKAREMLLRAVALAPNSASAHLSLGVVEVLLGHSEIGIKEFRRALEISPHNEAALYNLGKVLFDQGKYEPASKVFQDYLALNGSDQEALLYLFRCGIENHDPTTVDRTEKRLRAMQPQDTALHARMGRWLAQVGYLGAAEKEFALAANSAHLSFEVTSDYVGVLLEEARPKEALEVLSRVAEQDGNSASFHYLSGQCYEKVPEFRKAYEEYSKAISIDPAQETYYVSLASLLIYRQAYSAARQLLATASKRFPSSVTVIVLKGLAEVEDGNAEDAMQDYQTAIQVDPNSPIVWKLLGGIQMMNGNYSQAIQTFQKAGQLDPKNPQPVFYEGLAHAKVPNGTDAALECFFRSLKKNPELAAPYFWIGSLYLHRAHKYILAEKYLEQAVKRAPGWAAANQTLIQCYRILNEDGKAEALELRYKEAVRQSRSGPDGEALLEPRQ